jgi:hypothetical protein
MVLIFRGSRRTRVAETTFLQATFRDYIINEMEITEKIAKRTGSKTGRA